jgi:hypothetical protein
MNKDRMKALAATTIILAIAVMIMMMCGCSSLENKAVGISDSTSGFYLQTTASTSTTSLPSPTLWIARNQISVATAPVVDDGKKTQIVFTMSKSRSFFGSLFGIDDSAVTFSYIGSPNESPEDTVKRFEAFDKVANPVGATSAAASASSVTDSGTR